MRAALMAIGALSLGAAVSSNAAVAAFPGGNGVIAFSGKPGGSTGNWNIFTIKPGGSGMRQLTDSSNGDIPWESGAMAPSWSSDGQRIVYAETVGRYDPTVTPYLEVTLLTIDADGGNPTSVVDYVTSTHVSPSPSFSPSGGRILYAAEDGIRTIRPDGTEPQRLLSGKSPQYAPSGRQIVFAGIPEGKRRDGIWRMRRDGSHLRRLTDPEREDPELTDAVVDYSPDGRRIVFVRYSAVGPQVEFEPQLRVMRSDGSGEREMPPGLSTDLAFAPAGDQIAVPIRTVYDRFIFCSDLFTISPTGSGPQNLTNDCDPQTGFGREVASPSWQPDPPSTLIFGKVKRNKKRGTAKLTVEVFGTGELELAKNGKLKGKQTSAESEGTVKLPVKPTRKAKKKLRRKGKAKVKAEVTYTPDGGPPNTQSKNFGLKKKR